MSRDKFVLESGRYHPSSYIISNWSRVSAMNASRPITAAVGKNPRSIGTGKVGRLNRTEGLSVSVETIFFRLYTKSGGNSSALRDGLTASVHDSKERMRTISSSQIANLIFKTGLWRTTSRLQSEAKTFEKLRGKDGDVTILPFAESTTRLGLGIFPPRIFSILFDTLVARKCCIYTNIEAVISTT
ncbi:uncharacterized protein BT62DRAFT_1081014 [Guyanagaster necrorhizus]|uniref:Uncharacterized protein n=1 Tax=Guyanagaster necrorhizus TaxID=856835 RepID=A0A9P7VGS9_9AGAR|nr:uncharacterized protein BT62DRAFT_1081014 [Guyanagaster necrorhizus MCA 3950]KAG7440275.1 hypothetical protein BT62DRAFT_1081014 [Guyanagaster necrorhizus MCA 3950]